MLKYRYKVDFLYKILIVNRHISNSRLYIDSQVSQTKDGEKLVRSKQKESKVVVEVSMDSLQPSIDRSQGSVSAFQRAILIISWQGTCDTYKFLNV